MYSELFGTLRLIWYATSSVRYALWPKQLFTICQYLNALTVTVTIMASESLLSVPFFFQPRKVTAVYFTSCIQPQHPKPRRQGNLYVAWEAKSRAKKVCESLTTACELNCCEPLTSGFWRLDSKRTWFSGLLVNESNWSYHSEGTKTGFWKVSGKCPPTPSGN